MLFQKTFQFPQFCHLPYPKSQSLDSFPLIFPNPTVFLFLLDRTHETIHLGVSASACGVVLSTFCWPFIKIAKTKILSLFYHSITHTYNVKHQWCILKLENNCDILERIESNPNLKTYCAIILREKIMMAIVYTHCLYFLYKYFSM